MVLLPSPPVASNISEKLTQAVLNGICYENAMLYHVGRPLSKFIAPVMYMWRPFSRDDKPINTEQDPLPNGCSISGKRECSTSSRQLWIWIHAATFKEGFDALRFACEKQIVDHSPIDLGKGFLDISGLTRCSCSWLKRKNGLPSFPFDFPDCKAYLSLMAAEATAFDRATELRPLAVRPLRVPLPPPWECLMSSVEKGPNIIGDPQTLGVHHSGGKQFWRRVSPS